MTNEPIERDRYVSLPVAIVTERRAWLVVALTAAYIVYLGYVATHEYPAYAGGLYLQIAEEIISHNYALPRQIPGYTSTGVPFAYPPLMFYVTAVLLDVTNIEPLALVRFFPGIIVIAYLIPYYGIADELLSDPRAAGVATLFLGVTPTVLRWHLSSGGLVRAPAYLLALTGIYTGLKLFKSHDRRWLLASTVIFGLLVITHPTYTAFFVLSYLLIYAAFDRSGTGLFQGAVVGFGGVLVAFPWWGQIAMTHGVSIFSTAAGTHGGLGGDPTRMSRQMIFALTTFDVEWPFYIGSILGGGYYVWKRRFFLPMWMFLSGYIIGKARFWFVAGSILTAVFLFQAILPTIRQLDLDTNRLRIVSTSVVVLVLVSATTFGALYGASAVPAEHQQSTAQPPFLDEDDREAMAWMESNTEQSAQFVALGDAAEWIPYLAERTIILGAWGVEWKDAAEYYRQITLYDSMSACRDSSCLTTHIDRENLDPDYLYIPKAEYTVRGKEHVQSSNMPASLAESNRYDIVFENEGVLIVRVLE